jgi:glycosyltransferase involved in cell wall biosynthesis
MRVALVGHACSPYFGSEPGLTWNWAKHLARHHEVHVVTHPQYSVDIDKETALLPEGSRPIFHYVNLESRFDPWVPLRGEQGIRLHYRFWQPRATKCVAELAADKKFDLVHHVSWAAFNHPPTLWKTGLPFVWGPVGGGQTWPTRFLDYAGKRAMLERGRKLAVWLSKWNPNIISALKAAELIFATNHETADLIRRVGVSRRMEMYFDNGTPAARLLDRPHAPRPGPITLLWAGRCEPRKGLPIALRALAQARHRDVKLVVAGDGPDKANSEALARQLNIQDRVSFLGRVQWQRMFDLFDEASVFLFTSLRDSTGSVVLEAMARGLPIITLDHHGIGYLVTNEFGVKVPVAEPEQTVGDFAAAIDRLAADSALRYRMGEEALRVAAANMWDQRAARMTQWYEEVVRDHRRN